MEAAPPRRIAAALATAATATVGLAGWLGDVPFLVALGILGFVALGVPRLRGPALIGLVASPCVAPVPLGVATATVAYVDGSATAWRRGLRAPSGHDDLDPDGRYYRTASGGCLVSLVEGVAYAGHDTAHNLVLAGLARAFGPPRGAYLGEYPDADRATVLLLEEGVPVDADAWARRHVPLGDGGVVELSEEAFEWELDRSGPPVLAAATEDWVALAFPIATHRPVVVLDRRRGESFVAYAVSDEVERALWRVGSRRGRERAVGGSR